MLIKGQPLYKIHFETEEQYNRPIGLNNLKDPSYNNKSKSQSNAGLNLQFTLLIETIMLM